MQEEESDRRLKNLLEEYNITAPEYVWSCTIEKRSQMLLNILLASYCQSAGLSVWVHNILQKTISDTCTTLSQKLDILQSMLSVVLGDNSFDIVKELSESDKLKEYNCFIPRLVADLAEDHSNVAANLFYSYLHNFTSINTVNKGYLSHIILNRIWTPLQATKISVYSKNWNQETFTKILHMVQTYSITAEKAVAAVQNDDPVGTLAQFVDEEEDKSLDVILCEMAQLGYPEKEYQRLQKIICKTLNDPIIKQQHTNVAQLKNDVSTIDFNQPDCHKLARIIGTLRVLIFANTTKQLSNDDVIEGYEPRTTQLVALIVLLVSKTKRLNGCLLEISTGEGKTCIIAMLAAIFALQGKHVDIMTSSPVLAIRDSEEWSKLYTDIGLSSSVIPPKQLDGRINKEGKQKLYQENYQKDIVYGTIGSFAADLLEQEFNKEEIRGKRRLDTAIIDEVDLMTLDNGVQVTYLSHTATGLQHIEQILTAIWMLVCRSRPVFYPATETVLWTTGIQHFHKAVYSILCQANCCEELSELDILEPGLELGIFTEEQFDLIKNKKSDKKCLDSLLSKINPSEQRNILTNVEYFLDYAVQFKCFSYLNGELELFNRSSESTNELQEFKMLLLENGLASQVLTYDEFVQAIEKAINDKVRYSFEERAETNESNFMHIPSYLQPYLEDRLPIFVQNAMKAIIMTKDREYTIDRPQTTKDLKGDKKYYYDSIVPIDFKASGVLEKNKKWGDGLQQFLEMKHQLAISPLTTVTNFMSNYHLFQRYTNAHGVYGVTGTIGADSDCNFLSRHFKTQCYQMPTHKRKKLVELPAIHVKGGKKELLEKICQRIREIIAPNICCKGQAVLVVCEDMKISAEVEQKIFEKGVAKKNQIFMYTHSDRHKVEGAIFHSGDVIIATNLGGRGTDFHVDDDVNRSGGLFVLLTHFPANKRVEKQVFGRTARKGNPGMSQLILSDTNVTSVYKDENIDTMRDLRSIFERKRIEHIEQNELITLKIKEKLFKTFCKGLNKFYSITNKNEALRKTTLNAFKETWAQWLVLNECEMERNHHQTKKVVKKLQSNLSKILNTRAEELQEGYSDNFYDYVREAMNHTELHNMENLEVQKKSWRKAREVDPKYGAIAFYNEAFITLKTKGHTVDGQEEALELLQSARTSANVCIAEWSAVMSLGQMATSVGMFQSHHNGETNMKRQLDIRGILLKTWIEKIEKSIGKLECIKKQSNINALAKSKGIFAFVDNGDLLTEYELNRLYDQGLHLVFEVEEMPVFNWMALICACIGVLQVAVGAVILAVSFGEATTIALGLIQEGISDMIHGIKGIMTGEFDWAEWAVNKAINIGMSLLTAGIGNVVKESKLIFSAGKQLTFGKQTSGSVQNHSNVNEVKSDQFSQHLKEAVKYAGTELINQNGLTELLSNVLKRLEKSIERFITPKVKKIIQDSEDLHESIEHFILTFENIDEDTDSELHHKNEMHREIANICEDVLAVILEDTSEFTDLYSVFTDMKNLMTTINKDTIITAVKKIKKVIKSIRIERIVEEEIIPELVAFLNEINTCQKEKPHLKPKLLPLVDDFKSNLLDTTIDKVIERLLTSLTGHASKITKYVSKNISKKFSAEMSKIHLTYEKELSFYEKHHLHSLKYQPNTADELETRLYMKDDDCIVSAADIIEHSEGHTSVLDIAVLAASKLLNRKGIQIEEIDSNGKLLSSVTYTAKGASEFIQLRVQRHGTDNE